jgi:Predicted nucleotidyltransferases
MERETLFALLKSQQDTLRRQFFVASLSVFGSAARDRLRKQSDIDLLVEFERPVGLFTFIRLKLYLENLLGRCVDLVTPAALRPELRQQILQEAIHAL